MYKNPTQSGFSLVEILVSLSLFTVVAVVSVGSLLVLIEANGKAQTLKSGMDNLSFALDSMTRNIRTGYTYHCRQGNMTTLPNTTNNCTSNTNPGESLAYTDGETGDRVGYRLGTDATTGNGVVERCIGGSCSNNDNWVALTAAEVDVQNLAFTVKGTSDTDEVQPTVMIWISGVTGDFSDTQSDFSIQTTVTQRLLDVDA